MGRELKFSVSGRIAKPVSEVFEAVVNPAQLSHYFTTGGAKGRLETGATVTWDFHDFPGAFPVRVETVETDKKIVLHWGAADDVPEGEAAAPHDTTVLLDGQGADELLGGYQFYFRSHQMDLIDQRPGAPHQSVDAPMRGDGGFDRRSQRSFVGDVAPMQAGGTAERLDLTTQRLGALALGSPRDRDIAARAREFRRHRGTDAARRAEYQRGPFREQPIVTHLHPP